MRTDGRKDERTDGEAKLIIAFRNFANAPKIFCEVKKIMKKIRNVELELKFKVTRRVG